ncbi:MAG: FecR family protein [Tannerellaceae bacterium]|jgi:ferric-dicitrate binding protein FerR (iron transport regulator)|nr:FecR family protein [Tannerellaceae bacterium]
MKKEILYRFFEGLASPDEEKRISLWLDASSDNKHMFIKERKFFDAATLLTREAARSAGTIYRPGAARGPLNIPQWLRVAVAVCITAGLTSLYFLMRDDGSLGMQTVIVPAGQRVNLFLPDGSKVWLNARTKLTYPAAFGRKERVMQLEGEAYFEVSPETDKPFIVHTSKGSVTALGTTFNVEDYPDDNTFEAMLIKGKVSVTSSNRPDEHIILTPDKKTVWKDGRLSVEHVDDHTPYRWIEGLICFRNSSFLSMMKSFERYYGVSINVNNKIASEHYYTGKFRHSDGIDYALRVLQKDIRFTFGRDDDKQIIYIE